jgi:hypothetical protein
MNKRKRYFDGFNMTCNICEDHPPLQFIAWGDEGFYGCPNYNRMNKKHTTVSVWKYYEEYKLHKKQRKEERMRDLERLSEISIGFSYLPELFRRSCMERIFDHVPTENLILSIRRVCKEWYDIIMKRIIRSSDALANWRNLELRQRIYHLRMACLSQNTYDGIRMFQNGICFEDIWIDDRKMKKFRLSSLYHSYIVGFSTCQGDQLEKCITKQRWKLGKQDALFVWSEESNSGLFVRDLSKILFSLKRLSKIVPESQRFNILLLRHYSSKGISSKIKPPKISDIL